jgi:hypothetical protein
VLTSQGLTELYGAPVDVVRAQGRVIVVPSSEGYAPCSSSFAGRPRRRGPRWARLVAVWDKLFNFENYGELLALLHNSILAGAILGMVGGLIGVFVMMRDLTFAVHGMSELGSSGISVGRRMVVMGGWRWGATVLG